MWVFPFSFEVETPGTQTTKKRRSVRKGAYQSLERLLFGGFLPSAHRPAFADQPPWDSPSSVGSPWYYPSAFLMHLFV
jgi:hypothetical protein